MSCLHWFIFPHLILISKFIGACAIENLDIVERRRQKARDKYASLTEVQKEKKREKARKYYHRKKAERLNANMPQLSTGTAFSYSTYMFIILLTNGLTQW